VHVQRDQVQDDACFHIAGALMKNAGSVLNKKHAAAQNISHFWKLRLRVGACVHAPRDTHVHIHGTLQKTCREQNGVVVPCRQVFKSILVVDKYLNQYILDLI
jgi:hypothetical protein